MSGVSTGTPIALNAVVQLTDTSSWLSLTVPVPINFITFDSVTGNVKRGDGVTLYANLPVLLNLNQLISLATTVADLMSGTQPYVQESLDYYVGGGTDQNSATPLITQVCLLNGPGTLFRLPQWPTKTKLRCFNLTEGSVPVSIYPDEGSQFYNMMIDQPYVQDANAVNTFWRISDTVWLID